jgi:phosphate transport system permease protein
MQHRSYTWRIIKNHAATAISAATALIASAMLVWIIGVVLLRGGSALNWELLTQPPAPPGGKGGGVGPAIIGTIILTIMATFIGVPLGLFAGVFLSEYGAAYKRTAKAVRFAADLLVGVPSIIIGLFVYAVIVRTTGGFSAHAGGVALAVMIVPLVARTTEESLRMVPTGLREATLALGASRARLLFTVLLPAAKGVLLTGVLLAIARISGETAPLLLTCLSSPYWIKTGSIGEFSHSLTQPISNLTVTIFNQAMSPYANWQATAWAASLLIMLAVLTLTVSCRVVLLRRSHP